VLSQSALCTSGSICPNFVPPPGVEPPNLSSDLNATVGQHVTFWRANWRNANSLRGIDTFGSPHNQMEEPCGGFCLTRNVVYRVGST
jgi:hypothetical protein